MTWRPRLRFGRNLKGCGAWRASGKVGRHGKIFRQKAVWVTSEIGGGRAEKSRYDVPPGVGAKNRYEAELTNHVADRGQNSTRCILLYRTVARNGCGIPLSVVCPTCIPNKKSRCFSKLSRATAFVRLSACWSSALRFFTDKSPFPTNSRKK